jgi:hypothetical protein
VSELPARDGISQGGSYVVLPHDGGECLWPVFPRRNYEVFHIDNKSTDFMRQNNFYFDSFELFRIFAFGIMQT